MRGDASWTGSRKLSKKKEMNTQLKCLKMLLDSNNYRRKRSKRGKTSREHSRRLCRSMKQTSISKKSNTVKRWSTNKPRLMSSRKILTKQFTETKCQLSRSKKIEKMSSMQSRPRTKRT